MPQLDALRALAVMAVVVEHYGGRQLNAWFPISAGYTGVALFYTLSGFLITSLLLATFRAYGNNHGLALRNFYARRQLRLAVPFYLVLGTLIAVGLEPIASSWPWHAFYLTNVWIALGNPSNVLWSLAVEEQFYLFWPVLVLLAGQRNVMALCLGTIAAGLLFRIGWALSGLNLRPALYLLFGQLVLLGAGGALGALSFRNGKPFQLDWLTAERAKLFDIVAPICFVLAVIPWLLWGSDGYIRFLTLDALMSVVFCWLILRSAIGWKGAMGWVMTRPAMLFLGKISYMVYLTHNFVPRVYEHLLGPMPKLKLLVLTAPTVAAICVLSWFLIEKPLLKLKAYVPEAPRRPEPRGEAALERAS